MQKALEKKGTDCKTLSWRGLMACQKSKAPARFPEQGQTTPRW